MKISACVIVRDEEKNLPRWIASMQKIAEELVVVDTGSKDATPEIARRAGAHVYAFDWCDDFSAAKNFAIDRATGDWIVFCDADEYFPAEDAGKVRAAAARLSKEPSVLGFFCARKNIETDGRVRDVDLKPRVFRKLPGLRYHGRIHEVLEYTGTGKGEMRVAEDIQVLHTGYAAEVLPEKLRRNIRLLEAARGTAEERGVDAYYLAESYYGLGDFSRALLHIEAFLRTGLRVVGKEERPLSLCIQAKIRLERPAGEILADLAAAEKAYPKAPIFPWIRGQYALERGDKEGAREAFYDCAARGEEASPNPIEGRMAGVYAALGALSKERGELAEAADWWEKALAKNAYEKEALAGLLALLSAADDAELIAYLSRRYDAKRDAAFLLSVLPEERGRIALYYLRHGHIAVPPWTAYRLAGNLGAASAALFEERSALCRVILAAGSAAERASLPAAVRAASLAPGTPSEYRMRRALSVFLREYAAVREENV